MVEFYGSIVTSYIPQKIFFFKCNRVSLFDLLASCYDHSEEKIRDDEVAFCATRQLRQSSSLTLHCSVLRYLIRETRIVYVTKVVSQEQIRIL